MKTYCIYKITNLINSKSYLGYTYQVEKRFTHHIRGYENSSISTAIKKYGKDNFTFIVIEEGLGYKQALKREVYWIKFFDSYCNGYNQTLGGDFNPMLLPEIVCKASESRKGYKPSLETRQKVSKTLKDRGISKEHREKMVKGRVESDFKGGMAGKFHSKETRKKMSETRKGRISGEKNPMYGLKGKDNPNWGSKRSEKTKLKISLSRKVSCYAKKNSIDVAKKNRIKELLYFKHNLF